MQLLSYPRVREEVRKGYFQSFLVVGSYGRVIVREHARIPFVRLLLSRKTYPSSVFRIQIASVNPLLFHTRLLISKLHGALDQSDKARALHTIKDQRTASSR